MAFLRSYVRLMELRFPHSLRVALPAFEATDARRLPTASLQLLIENAIKHNRFSEAEPLTIDVCIERNSIVVVNPVRPKAQLPLGANTGTGLANLRERIALLTLGELEVTADGGEFHVRVPLVS